VTDHYAVIGNPIAHSRSPAIHAAFAAQTGQDMVYTRLLAPLDGFEVVLNRFRAEGGRGVNVTVPFKETAWQLAEHISPRAQQAQAVNTLSFTERGVEADNTDGAGLVNDLSGNLGFALAGKRILLMGAGGAARGVTAALLAEAPLQLVIVNRTVTRAELLVQQFSALGPVSACDYAALGGQSFDCVINATSASLHHDSIELPQTLFSAHSLAYDMMYASKPSAFMTFARQYGATRCVDGLGMLVEQAAVAFSIWRGVMPDTQPVLKLLRDQLQTI
jgi:shikimate dehydrogenase